MQNNFDAQKMMNPLIVQSDRSILMDVHAPLADECRNALIPFAELERSPEHLHTYRLTPLSLWNATSAGFTYQDAIDVLRKYSRFDVPQSVEVWIEETAGRFGKLRMIPAPCEVVEFEKKAGHFPDDVVVNTFKRPVLVKVATVKKNELDKNTKDAEYHIDYTVCPCMPYGVLDHLAISNTIDFNKNQDGSVNLDTWKYYVNADSITLNYGLTTNLKEDENEVVEKVVMEFYDNQGLSASYEIKNQDTFDAKFTEYIELDKESSNYKILNTRIPENSISRELTELIPHAGEYAG